MLLSPAFFAWDPLPPPHLMAYAPLRQQVCVSFCVSWWFLETTLFPVLERVAATGGAGAAHGEGSFQGSFESAAGLHFIAHFVITPPPRE